MHVYTCALESCFPKMHSTSTQRRALRQSTHLHVHKRYQNIACVQIFNEKVPTEQQPTSRRAESHQKAHVDPFNVPHLFRSSGTSSHIGRTSTKETLGSPPSPGERLIPPATRSPFSRKVCAPHLQSLGLVPTVHNLVEVKHSHKPLHLQTRSQL